MFVPSAVHVWLLVLPLSVSDVCAQCGPCLAVGTSSLCFRCLCPVPSMSGCWYFLSLFQMFVPSAVHVWLLVLPLSVSDVCAQCGPCLAVGTSSLCFRCLCPVRSMSGCWYFLSLFQMFVPSAVHVWLLVLPLTVSDVCAQCRPCLAVATSSLCFRCLCPVRSMSGCWYFLSLFQMFVPSAVHVWLLVLPLTVSDVCAQCGPCLAVGTSSLCFRCLCPVRSMSGCWYFLSLCQMFVPSAVHVWLLVLPLSVSDVCAQCGPCLAVGTSSHCFRCLCPVPSMSGCCYILSLFQMFVPSAVHVWLLVLPLFVSDVCAQCRPCLAVATSSLCFRCLCPVRSMSGCWYFLSLFQMFVPSAVHVWLLVLPLSVSDVCAQCGPCLAVGTSSHCFRCLCPVRSMSGCWYFLSLFQMFVPSAVHVWLLVVYLSVSDVCAQCGPCLAVGTSSLCFRCLCPVRSMSGCWYFLSLFQMFVPSAVHVWLLVVSLPVSDVCAQCGPCLAVGTSSLCFRCLCPVGSISGCWYFLSLFQMFVLSAVHVWLLVLPLSVSDVCAKCGPCLSVGTSSLCFRCLCPVRSMSGCW